MEKHLKYASFKYDDKTKALKIIGVDGGDATLPRHYMISLMRFGLRILQAGKPRNK